MTQLPGRRVGVAIVRVEAEDAAPDRFLIRVTTVHDVSSGEEPVSTPFTTVEHALAYLRTWLSDLGAGP